MKIIKKYHFYAAHRNEYLYNKCKNLHGHTYYVEIEIQIDELNASGVGILFEDIDKIVLPIINEYDHSTLIHKEDSKLLNALSNLETKTKILDSPTTAENISICIFNTIKAAGLPICSISLQETLSSIVNYP